MSTRHGLRAGAAAILAAALLAAAAPASARSAPPRPARTAAASPPGAARPAPGQAPSGREPLSRAQIRAGLRAPQAAAAVRCVSPAGTHPVLAVRLARRITAALRGRSSIVGLTVLDRRTGISCALHPFWHFISASVVKVTILGALLRKLQAEHRRLTRAQVGLTAEMITESSNAAASALWAQVGRWHLQRFLDLAGMHHTRLGPGGYWGLTELTAHDELTLLQLLTSDNTVLTPASRRYALTLMARVIPAQRWGTPAGVPAGVTVHVKNGWLPLPEYGWRINSIGCFSGDGRNYMIAMLTQNNPTMTYGVDTIEDAAEVINHRLG